MATDTAQANEFGPPSPERRRFLTMLSIGLSAVGGLIIGLPFMGFLLAPLLKKPPTDWVTVGPASRFKVGETVQVDIEDPSPKPWTGVASRTAVWLRRDTE